MTVGIGACGPQAGRAVFEALRAIERVGHGAVGGFATFAAIAEDGRTMKSATQRGGTATLFTDGETTGVEPPDAFASARVAGVISSGPDRPAPLEQFIPVDPAVGLVTGHRIPPTTGAKGKPMNGELLSLLQAGTPAETALASVIGAAPEADCGLIAVTIDGTIACANTERVMRRPDVGLAIRRDDAGGIGVAVLYNAIRPRQVLADLAAAIALDVMRADTEVAGDVTLVAGTELKMGPENAVFCDAERRSVLVTTTDPAVGERGELGAAVYLQSKVYVSDTLVGETTFEPITTIENGRLTTFSGKPELRMTYR